MSYNTWPTFAGRGWNIKKRPLTKTIIETADGGQEFRLSRFQSPLYEFDIEIPYLSQADYATLQNFFAQQGGPFTPFLFYPDNEAATATPFFTGDGVTTQATLLMPDGSPALAANSGATPTVSAIHQTDWQGRLALANQPRANDALAYTGIGTTGWGVNGTPTFTQGQADPAGGTKATLVATNAASNGAYQAVGSLTAGETRYLYAFFKPASAACLAALQFTGTPFNSGGTNPFVSAYFDLIAGTATWDYIGGTYLAIEPLANGWFRCTIGGKAVASGTFSIAVYSHGAAAQSFYAFGPQCATSLGAYIPTTSAAATVTDYTQAGNQITFGQVPSVGAVEDWDGTYEYLVRFKDDQIEMTQTMSQIYEATTVTLRSVR